MMERKVDYDELLEIKELQTFIELLIKNNVSENMFKAVLMEPRDTCDGRTDKYVEYVIVPNISFLFLGITNISDEAIKLQRLTLKDNKYPMPLFQIRRDDMVFLPIGTLMNLSINPEESIQLSVIPGDRGQFFIRNYNRNIRREIEFIGERLDVEALEYTTQDCLYNLDIHEFNADNFYSISKDWMCGCCPHLFFFNGSGKQIYSRELLKKASNKFGVDSFEVPEDIKKIIIRELEDETTYLEKIYINNKVAFSNIKLEKEEFFIFDVNSFDIIKVEGYYKPFLNYESNENGIILRNKYIENSNYKYNMIKK